MRPWLYAPLWKRILEDSRPRSFLWQSLGEAYKRVVNHDATQIYDLAYSGSSTAWVLPRSHRSIEIAVDVQIEWLGWHTDYTAEWQIYIDHPQIFVPSLWKSSEFCDWFSYEANYDAICNDRYIWHKLHTICNSCTWSWADMSRLTWATVWRIALSRENRYLMRSHSWTNALRIQRFSWENCSIRKPPYPHKVVCSRKKGHRYLRGLGLFVIPFPTIVLQSSSLPKTLSIYKPYLHFLDAILL